MFFKKTISSNKKSIKEVFYFNTLDFMEKAGIYKTSANIVKTSAYITFLNIAFLNTMRDKDVRATVDMIVEGAKDCSIELNRIRIKDLATNPIELNRLLNEFPKELQANEKALTNGLAAFEAIYNAYVEEIVQILLAVDITEMFGLAARIISEGLLGKGQFKTGSTVAESKLMEMTKELIIFANSN